MICKTLEYSYDRLEITGMWANVLKPGESHPPHTHSNNFFIISAIGAFSPGYLMLISKKLVKGLKIVTVSNVDDVLKHSLTKKISPIDWSKIPVTEKKTTDNELIV